MTRATIKDVAAEAEVSTATVSRVLNDSGYVSPEVRERVKDAISKLRYEPSAIARSLKQDKTFMIGVIVPDISNPYFMEMSRGIEDIVGQEGFQLTFCSSDESPDKESRLLQLLSGKRVDSIVLATSGGNVEAVEALISRGLPVILVDRRPDGRSPKAAQFDLVAENNMEGAYRLTRTLLDDGHTRIGVVNGPSRVSTGRERFDGVLKALKESDLGMPLVYNGDFSAEGGVRAIRTFLKEERKPTAVVSLNNRMSFGVLLELVRSGVRIPDDMAVASFGEVEAGRLLKSSGLIYIDQHPYDMGRRAGEILLGRIHENEPDRKAVTEIFSNEVKRLL